MRDARRIMVVFLGMVLLAMMACALPFNNPIKERPAVVATAEEKARSAGKAAQTAAAQAMAMATTEGGPALGTVKALAAPHVDVLKDKVASVEPDAEGNYRVTLTEEEVNTVLRLRQLLSGDILGAGGQSQEVSFREGRITLSGRILEPLPGELVVTVRPTVEEGRLKLETEEASLAGREAPQQALAAAEGALNSTLGEALDHLPAGVRLLGITAANGELTISGIKVDDGG